MRFVDCNQDLLQRVGSVEWTDIEGGSHQFVTGDIVPAILPDRLHLSDEGYEKWTECLLRHFEQANATKWYQANGTNQCISIKNGTISQDQSISKTDDAVPSSPDILTLVVLVYVLLFLAEC